MIFLPESPLEVRSTERPEMPNGSDGRLKLPDVLGLELANIIEDRIIRLELGPGKHLTEQQICSEFDVSRSPVREAFRQLEAIGLVVRHKRRGVRVTPMTHEHVDEIYVVRTSLESIAAALATRNATENDLNYLGETVDRLNTALSADDPEGFFNANIDYFERVHSITGNSTLEQILRMIEKQAMRYRYFAHRYSHQMKRTSSSSIQDVYRHMCNRDAEAVHAATTTMMEQAHELIVSILAKYPSFTDEPPGDP